MIFFLCFLCSQLLRAETQDLEGMLVSVLNALTTTKNMSRSISEEYQRKLAYWKGLERGYPGLEPKALG